MIDLMDEQQTAYISSSSFLDLYDALISLGVISANTDIGIERAALLDVEKRIPVAMQARLWAVAKYHDCPRHIGLLVGSQLNKEARGMLSHLIRYADDLRDALNLHQQYIAIMSENERVNIEQKSWGCRITIECYYDKASYIPSIERSLSALLTWGRELTKQDFFPLKVSVIHQRQAYEQEYQKIFGDNIHYNQKSVYMDIGDDVLNLVNVDANQYMRKILKSHVDTFLQDIKTDQSLSAQVSRLIESTIANEDYSSQAVAEALNISRQTLHRRLKKEGTCFREILASLRKTLAVDYLADTSIHLDKISSLLGFKETSAFHRAFKYWFDDSPGSFRKRLGRRGLDQ
jgi:AraC-like DNA-binding protein